MQAILITAYKNYSHLKDLINFFDNHFSIYIHIDKKSNITKDQINELKNHSNVYSVSQQYKINWGGINHLKSILELMQQALELKENKCFHLITGHDYPIKTLKELINFEEIGYNQIHMEHHPLPYTPWPEGGLDRLSRYNMYDLIDGRSGFNEKLVKGFSKIQKKLGLKRKFYKNFPKLYGGSTYWSMGREAIEYIFKYMNENPKYLNRFKYSFCSEEIYFQTILLNSPLKELVVNNNKRFIIWENRNGNFPANLDNSDLPLIQASDALFARKFEYPISENILREIKKNITNS